MENHTERTLEQLRGQLIATAMYRQSFLDRDVLLLSQSMDQLIVKVQKEKQRMLDKALVTK